jgi:hypothetical protein
MRTIRTTLRPDAEQQVDDEEAEVLRAHGLLLPLITDTIPVEEVTPDGGSEEGGSEERDGVQGGPSPDREEGRSQSGPGSGDPRQLDAQGLSGGEESQPEPEEGSA